MDRNWFPGGQGAILEEGDATSIPEPPDVPANPAEAVWLFQAAADRGSILAMRNLGVMYETGQGVAADQRRAIEYYRKAAAGGDDVAAGELRRLGVR